ncbi:copper resistance protein B [Pseudoxanthomonas sp. PXM02]|uniref:copper resistance protein B n=1 Tax=Pseudoxanthomonas sp. PXM02 TaxID=2769294 RepID=UPI0017846883|nr:copper resistance protein B [Pseudoxanthomonas sp. PXM02]MBD9481213.1 copper resistance protein B [Pseudoxanthomonas sp. PXM02]
MKTILSPAPLSIAVLAALALAIATPAFAQHHDHAGHTAPEPVAVPEQDEHAQHDHAAMGHADHGTSSPAPREAIPPVTAEDLAAAFPAIDHHAMQHAPAFNTKVTLNRLEAWDADEGTGQAWEGIAWFGTDTDRLWLRSEGERIGGHTESADVEALYGHSVSPWWDVVAGVKHDFKPGDARSWAAFGVQGMAPYRFEVSATAYVGEGGQVTANFEAEYTLRITNRLILQPLVEVDLAAKDDPGHGIASGLSGVEAGLRLRYEVTRRFAPYVGVVHERAVGDTADLRRAADESARDTRVVAGVRIWF